MPSEGREVYAERAEAKDSTTDYDSASRSESLSGHLGSSDFSGESFFVLLLGRKVEVYEMCPWCRSIANNAERGPKANS